MANKKYSVIVFDLGNVLIPFNYNLVIERLNNVETGLGNRFLEYYNTNYHIHRAFERGDITEEEFIDKMLASIDYKINGETFCKFYSEIFTVNTDVADLLPKLKKNYSLVLLSNTNSIHREYGWKDNDFLKHFDKLILSHEANAVKPEEKIYRAVEAYTGKPSEEHIFIDDIEDYVVGAKKLGWDGIQFKGYDKLIEELKDRDIIV